MKFLKLAIIYGVPFGISIGLSSGFSYGLWYGVVGGIASGILFGVAMAIFFSKMKKRINKIESLAKESIVENEILFSSLVNLIDGFMPKLGWLTLTKAHLIFTHDPKNNSEADKIEIALTSIKEVKTCKHRLNPNVILVNYDGKEQKFLMDGFGETQKVNNTVWVHAIQKAIVNITKKPA